MKFTISWLKDYLETDATLDLIVERLTEVGLEVEDVTNPADALGQFTVAHVIETVPHPDADRLRVCQVDTGTEIVQVVCGAPNARTGLKGVFAASGTYVPGIDVTLKTAIIRGVESNGMLCSEREMMLSDEHDGIIDLPADAPVGARFVDVMGLDDPIIEIAITPNRQDCLGVEGIARDLAATGLGRFKPGSAATTAGSFASPVGVTIQSTDACPVFAGRYIRGIKNGPSPKWMQDRLKAVGLRPISALVDITNYVTVDHARPLHVYDPAKLNGDIHVRLAKDGEGFLALDDKEYTLHDGVCVIADDGGVIGAGGIMGGATSGCSDATTDVFVECALFDPITTALSGRRLGIDSDARYRFERGVDPAYVIAGMDQATRLILEICGGEPSDMVVAGAEPRWDKTVTFRPERIAGLGGLRIDDTEARDILVRLGFTVSGSGDSWTISVPSWRVDIDCEPDIVEEIVRIKGLAHVPAVPMPALGSGMKATLTAGQRRARRVRRALASAGLNEAVTWSFMSGDIAKFFGGGQADLQVDNPISSELDWMRPSILPNLIQAGQRNRDRGFKSVALFEVGPQYRDASETGQDLVAAGVRAGVASERHWLGQSANVSVFDAKADALAALEAAAAPVANLQVFGEAPGWFHPGRSGTLRLGPKKILANFGELHPRVLKALDVDGPIVGFEVFLDTIPPKKSKGGPARARFDVRDLPSVERDFAFLMPREVPVEKLVRAVRGADKTHISTVSVFDVYEGDGVGPNEKSIAISVRLEPAGQTFRDADLTALHDKIVAAAAKAVGATLRG